MLLRRHRWSQHTGASYLIMLVLPHCEARTVYIREAFSAVQALHAGNVALQSPLIRGKGQPAGMTEPMHTRLELMVEGHPLIEHKTFPLPAAVRFRHLFEVIQDATL